MTMVMLLEEWEINLEKIVIHSLQDNTFYAVLCCYQGEIKKEIDCRPSDAIAIALRTDASIWVMEEVIADASIPVDQDADEKERQAFRDFVSGISPQTLIQQARFSSGSDSELGS